jgi:hypothetical protein
MDSCTATVELIETRSYWDFKYSWRMKVVEGEGENLYKIKELLELYLDLKIYLITILQNIIKENYILKL